MIVLYGSKGSMGRRYQAILTYLKEPFFAVDLDTDADTIPHEQASGYIVATPTGTHLPMVRYLVRFGKKILCEKPVSKDLAEVQEFEEMKYQGQPVSMVAQYRHLLTSGPHEDGPSLYNYYRHGSDGLAWDCIQIIGFAHERPVLRGDSPIWECKINGQRLQLTDMDAAYVTEVRDFLRGDPGVSGIWIRRAHELAAKYQGELDHGQQ